MLDRLEFLFEETWVALRRNGMMTLSAISTSAIALLIFGGLAYSYFSLVQFLGSIQSEFELRVSVVPEATSKDIERMENDLEKIDGVAQVHFLSKEEVWRKFLAKQKDAEFFSDIPNPMPNEFVIILSDLSKTESVKEQLMNYPLVDKSENPPIRDAKLERERAQGLIRFVKIFGGIICTLAFVTAGTLIYNTIRLTINSRRQELRIMQLMGASHATIRLPLIFEGGIQGGIGGLIGGLFLWLFGGSFVHLSTWTAFSRAGEEGSFPGFFLTVALTGLGVVLGMICATLSVRRYLGTGT
ncbi:MAG TPA: permease-like cell division protein FtsX [Fimbriimonadales bacterium]|nr:permease-like cell division protein FtsX [Fimbriimonadales bacterium]